MKECIICGKPNSENHHIVFRGQCKPLEHCKKNQVYLCYNHHRGTYGVHGKYGHELDMKLKLDFQNWLEETFCQERYTLEEVRKKLDISQNAIRSLSKLMQIDRGMFTRQAIIRTCMGGKLIELEEIK